MTIPRLPQYDSGPHPLAALVGGAIGGFEKGYETRRKITTDRRDDQDKERQRLIEAIKLRIELENAGYDPDNLEGNTAPPKEGPGLTMPRTGGPAHPGHYPMDEDPRDFGVNRPPLPGMHGFDPYAPGELEEQANPFRIPDRSVDPGMVSRFPGGNPDPGMGRPSSQNPDPGMSPRRGDPRSRVADILFQGTPSLRKTRESAQERRDRLQYERQAARDSADFAFRGGEGEATRRNQREMNDADNATQLQVARINAAARIADDNNGTSGGQREMQSALTSVKGIVDSYDRALAQAERAIPQPTPQEEYGRARAGYHARIAPQLARIEAMRAVRDEWAARRAAMIERQLQGVYEFRDLLPQPAPAPSQGPPRVDIRGRAPDGSIPPLPGQQGNINLGAPPDPDRPPSPQEIQAAQQLSAKARRILAAIRARTDLTPSQRQQAEREVQAALAADIAQMRGAR